MCGISSHLLCLPRHREECDESTITKTYHHGKNKSPQWRAVLQAVDDSPPDIDAHNRRTHNVWSDLSTILFSKDDNSNCISDDSDLSTILFSKDDNSNSICDDSNTHPNVRTRNGFADGIIILRANISGENQPSLSVSHK